VHQTSISEGVSASILAYSSAIAMAFEVSGSTLLSSRHFPENPEREVSPGAGCSRRSLRPQVGWEPASINPGIERRSMSEASNPFS
jgi:hypothetical protein